MVIEKYYITETKMFKLELRNIIYYIAYNMKEPYIAKKKYNKIKKQIYTLDKSPERCPKVFDDNTNIRKLIFDSYIVIYEIKTNTRTSIYSTYISFKAKLFK